MILRTMARKAVGIARGFMQWAEAEPVSKQGNQGLNGGNEGLAYPLLNSILLQIHDQTPKLRPNYTWGLLHGAHLARSLGFGRVSAIEFGVAGGNGLIALERAAEKVELALGVGIDVYGFDTGAGLPPPQDYRDLPNLWHEQAFPMDVDRLKQHLKRSQLLLGPVESTLSKFIDSSPGPVAFISFDLDYYSSTMHAFKLLEADQTILLPRIHCYFDDILGNTYSEYTGERLAIRHFNVRHRSRKISPIYGLKYFLPERHANEAWSEMFYLVHIFDHDLYCAKDGLLQPSRYNTTNLRVDPYLRARAENSLPQ
jgi:hypothetical protein